jgi:hypothetical protein
MALILVAVVEIIAVTVVMGAVSIILAAAIVFSSVTGGFRGEKSNMLRKLRR